MRYLKCESCGAIVKELAPCTCKDCGIKCCGKNMIEIPDPKLQTTKVIKTCKSCGAKVEVIVDCTCGDCGFKCCDKAMK